MAGHSKWANIKFRKAAQDAKRGKVFTKLIAEITSAARLGGGDADANPRLRAAVEKALAANMTRDTIQRAVKRGSGDGAGAGLEEIRYEGYGPAGMAVLVECATDNRNRTVSAVRHAFTKHGGNLGTDGSVAHLFTRMGSLMFSEEADEERIMEIALAAGADDVESEDGVIQVLAPWQEHARVEQAFVEAGLLPELSELIQHAAVQIELDEADAEKAAKLIDALEQLDDVSAVFTNGIFPQAD